MKVPAFLLALLIPFGAWAASYEFGTVVNGSAQVEAGDKLVVNGVKIQLWGIEALPATFPVGSHAKQALEDFVNDRKVNCMCQATGEDLVVNGRRVQCIFKRGRDQGWHMGRCFVGGLDLSKAMVAYGWAVNNDVFTNEYQGEEDFAHLRCIGMWSGEMCGIYETRHY